MAQIAPVQEAEQRVIRQLREQGPASAAELAGAIGLDRLAVRRALNRLRPRGLVRMAALRAARTGWGASGFAGVWEAVPGH